MKILNITQDGLSIIVEIEGFVIPFSCYLPLFKTKEYLLKALKNAVKTRDENTELINETNKKYITWVNPMIGEEIG